jgi:DNA modification methylase
MGHRAENDAGLFPINEGPFVAYESEHVTLWQGDASLVLPGIETESLDLVVTDPPYGVDWQSGFRTESFDRLANDGSADREIVRGILRESVRLVGQNRHLYVFGPTDVLEGLKVSATTPLVWDKATIGGGDLTSPWAPAHEPINFVTSKHRHAGQTGKEGVANRVRKGSVLRFPRPTGRKVRHPSEKPVALLRELIESSSRQGETVLDPFAGIGSTGVAAILSGRRAVLVELDPRYVAIAVERIKQAEAAVAMGASA